MRTCWFATAIVALLAVCCIAQEARVGPSFSASANRLAYLDEPCDPYYVGRHFPKLVTPQWVGEEGVDAVVTLAIDDMRDPAKYETYLRPILDRLKKIDGRAPVSIMSCDVKPDDPQLQAWLKEGLSLEVHTIDHPCPLLTGGDFAKAKSTYDRCVDLMASIPGNKPVAFRTPCCDSLNTPSPRMYAEIFNKTTEKGNYLQIDSSVFNIFSANDPELPREIVLENGKERFRKYLPFKSFVNTIEDYPYPYVIGRTCWQFPCMVPSDWEAQNIQRPNNPQTVEDMKRALDATIIKQGVFNLVFHPHGWIRAEQVVELIDYAEKTYGKRVKFLNFREALERINKNLLTGSPIAGRGEEFGVRLLDLNNDGYMDVLVAREFARGGSEDIVKTSRIWMPLTKQWMEIEFPALLTHINKAEGTQSRGVRFAILHKSGLVSALRLDKHVGGTLTNSYGRTGWTFDSRLTVDGNKWHEDRSLIEGLEIDGTPLIADTEQPVKNSEDVTVDRGVRLRDVDGDGIDEVIASGPGLSALFQWREVDKRWARLPFALPEGAVIADSDGNDAGCRLIDIDEDGDLDVLFSNEKEFGLYLFTDMKSGWSTKVRAGKRGDANAIPAITRGGTNNGAFFHSRHLWVQNEDTARMPDLVDRVSFDQLLADTPPEAKSPDAALKSMRVRPGFTVELVAAEPLVADPVAFDWGPDGKLWVVEMADYPNGIDGKGKPGGRVRFLEDANGDGKYDKSTVFLEGLGFPNGIMAWGRGVIVTCAPDLFYAEDTDGDGKADKHEVLFTGFVEGNQQHRFNSPAWGLDNWVYLANGDSGGEIRSTKTGKSANISGRDVRVRIDPRRVGAGAHVGRTSSPSYFADDGAVDPQAGQTQFGRAQNDWGDWFGCSNPIPIWQYVLDDHYLRRNPHVLAPSPRRDLGRNMMIARVFPQSRTLARFNDLHTANRFTSCCGLTIYRDELFGEAGRGAWFVCEPVHNLVHCGVMRAEGCGFTSQRPAGEEEREFLASTDNWFRPVMARTGPDGALWIADMYRAVIEHPEWIPDDWEKRLDLRAGHDKGRIYRIYPVDKKPRAIPRLDKLDTAGLVAALDSPSGWQRDMAQRMLIARNDVQSMSMLERIASDSRRAEARVHALCTLDGMGKLSADVVAARLGDEHPGVRRTAVRLSEGHVAGSRHLADALVKLADAPVKPEPADAIVSDKTVARQLGYSLGAWNDPRAAQALGRLLVRYSTDEYITAAAMSSINAANVDLVVATVLGGVEGKSPTDDLVGRLLVLSATLGDEQSLSRVAAVVTATEANKPHAPWQLAALAGLFDELAKRKAGVEELSGEIKADALRTRIDRMIARAAEVAANAEAAESDRLSAVRLLGTSVTPANVSQERLVALLAPQESATLQQAAIRALARLDHPAIAAAMLARWSEYTPALRRAVLEGVFSREQWLAVLLDHVESGKVAVKDLDAARRQTLLTHRSDAIRTRAAKLLSATLDGDRAKVVEQHRDVLKLSADATRGKAVFGKHCASCHRLEGVGQDVGAELDALANRSPDALLIAILDPNRAVEDKFLAYAVRATDGRQLSGILASETGNSLTLLGQDAKREELLRTEIDEVKAIGKSFMPEGLEKDLSKQDLADLIAYVAKLGPPAKKFAGNTPGLIEAAADGSLDLPASRASIYGPSLVFEQQYGNLGYWSNVADQATWRVQIPRAGAYRVVLDFACANGNAANTLLVEAAGSAVNHKVEATGTWDDYRHTTIGTLALPAGEIIVVARPGGEPNTAMIDLRTIRLTPVGKD